jgi:hypothetical protein
VGEKGRGQLGDMSAPELGRRIERLLELRLGGVFSPVDAMELSELYALERSGRPGELQRTAFGLEITQDTFGRAFTDEWSPL